MINVRPGGVFKENMSSDVIASSAPGMSRYRGRPPTAIRIFLAESLIIFPSFVVPRKKKFILC